MDQAHFVKFSSLLAFSLLKAPPLDFNRLLIPGDQRKQVKRSDSGKPTLQM